MRLFRHELKSELLLYVRSRELAFFTFLFPIILFVLLGSSYGNDRIKSEGNVRGANFLEAGMIGYGAISIAFAGLAIVLVLRRESGVLKRLRATPLPAPAYIVALLSSFLAAFAVEVLAIVVLGRLLFSIGAPDRIGSLVLILLLGAVSFAGLGIGLTALIRSAVRWIAAALPLTYFLRIVRGVMLHGHEIWMYPGSLAMIAAWGVLGVVLAIRGFRWEPVEAG
ncbi:MAG: ABC transporter permease [Actinobacteria bacterium]|nr:MAG: ABC transporter permease [Actinomycetota bacterium]